MPTASTSVIASSPGANDATDAEQDAGAERGAPLEEERRATRPSAGSAARVPMPSAPRRMRANSDGAKRVREQSVPPAARQRGVGQRYDGVCDEPDETGAGHVDAARQAIRAEQAERDRAEHEHLLRLADRAEQQRAGGGQERERRRCRRLAAEARQAPARDELAQERADAGRRRELTDRGQVAEDQPAQADEHHEQQRAPRDQRTAGARDLAHEIGARLSEGPGAVFAVQLPADELIDPREAAGLQPPHLAVGELGAACRRACARRAPSRESRSTSDHPPTMAAATRRRPATSA